MKEKLCSNQQVFRMQLTPISKRRRRKKWLILFNKKTLRWLTSKCKAGENVSVMSHKYSIHTGHTKHPLLDLFNVCSNHVPFKLHWPRKYKNNLHFRFWHSEVEQQTLRGCCELFFFGVGVKNSLVYLPGFKLENLFCISALISWVGHYISDICDSEWENQVFFNLKEFFFLEN